MGYLKGDKDIDLLHIPTYNNYVLPTILNIKSYNGMIAYNCGNDHIIVCYIYYLFILFLFV